MSDISRRSALAALTAAGAGALAACRRRHESAPLVPLPEGWTQGEERWVATTCGQCPAGCGIRVRVYEGRAVKIEGDPRHPVNQGGIGPKGQAGLQLLYHPDRIRGPLRRVGPRGAGRWESISWDAAIAEIAGELRRLRNAGDARSLAVLDGEPRGVAPRLWDRFLHAYGSPNHITHASTGEGAMLLALAFMQGGSDMPAYDWPRTNYVMSFGANLLESSCQTIHMARATTAIRGGTPGRRAKFVHVSPRFSMTAAKADEWISLPPGTYGALALGLAHVLIRDGLYDAGFVRDHTFGFDDWRDDRGRRHRGFRDLVITDFPLDKVASITNLDVSTIERLAREMSAHRPAIAVADGEAAGATNGLGTAMAIHALNALAGNLERPGGVLATRAALSGDPWPAVDVDALARKGLQAERIDGAGTAASPLGNGAIQHVPDAILSGRPYPVNALVLSRSNPVFSKPEGARWIDALARIPLVVSCSPLPDESTFWADFVLPDHTYLERAEIVEPAPGAGRAVVGLRQPVIPPRFDTMATPDVIIRLARALPAPVAGAFPWQDSAEAVDALLSGTTSLEELRDKGSWSAEPRFEQWESAFATPSRRFEFYSQTIAARLASHFPSQDDLERHLERRGVMTRGDDLCLPHWEPAQYAGSAHDYPFLLAPHRTIGYAEGGVRHLPWLRELPSAGRLAWYETIELHPRDAAPLEVEDGDEIWIESPAGRRRVRVRVETGVPAGVVGLPLGHGPWPPDPADAGTAGGHALLAALSDPLAGTLARHGTRVRLRKEIA